MGVVAAGYEIGVGRAVPTAAALIALVGVVAGLLALRRVGDRVRAVVAVAAGAVGVIAGGVHGAYAAGGLGTGNGLAGAVIAVVLGLIALLLGGIALVRSRNAVGGSR